MSLGSRLVLRIVIGMFVIAIVLFLPAGTLRFWQGWAYLAVWFIPGPVFSLYFHKRDPALVERRLQSKEKEKEQKVVMGVVYVVFSLAYLIPGLDFRFGWSSEKVLRRDLPGYAEYCEGTRYRLIPYIW